ncbi:MAG: rod shape-determining protein MreC, partial [Bacteroidota bacterium]
DYFQLQEVNLEQSKQIIELRAEIDQLRAQLEAKEAPYPMGADYWARSRAIALGLIAPKDTSDADSARTDSLAVDSLKPVGPPTRKAFNYLNARVVNNNTMGAYNYITLNRGREHGVRPGMGVISANGVVGVVSEVSDNYALAMSMLNKRLKVSAKILKKGIVGSLNWDGTDPRFAKLLYIPLHNHPSIDDTVVTSNYSTIFPEGMVLGQISSIEESEENGFYDIRVKLENDFNRLDYVYIVEQMHKAEIDSLEARKR